MFVSMTGFGRSHSDAPFGKLVIEIQSVNRKFLEIAISLPRELNRFDIEIRKWVQEYISRGQVSIRISLTPNDAMLQHLLPNAALLKRMKKAWIQLANEVGVDPQEIDLSFLLERLPAVSSTDLDAAEEDQRKALKDCLEKALHAAVEMKKIEGKALAKDIGKRIDELDRIVHHIEKLSPNAVEKLRQKLRERMEEILKPGSDLDEKLLREIAFFAEKIDIAEEITRSYSHMAQFREIIQSKDGQVGRKLEFLVQEMGREINTIGSKSADAEISRLIVDAKSELEKIREQIQNIE